MVREYQIVYDKITVSAKLALTIIYKNTYKIRPSSPADQKMHGLSGAVASRLTRCE